MNLEVRLAFLILICFIVVVVVVVVIRAARDSLAKTQRFMLLIITV